MPYMGSSGNSTVDAMGQFAISGNITPMEWYKTILRENGKPYLLAITILSDVVYWFRPTEVRDERTGQVIGWRKKFSGDLLQKSYKQYENLFGESRRSIKAAFDALVGLGVIKREFRDVKIGGVEDEKTLYNVMFLDLNVERLNELTYPETKESCTAYNTASEPELPGDIGVIQNNAGGGTKFCMTSQHEMYEVVQNDAGTPTKECSTLVQRNVAGDTANRGTYTEITPEITDTENITSLSSSNPVDVCKTGKDFDADNSIDMVKERVNSQISYELLHKNPADVSESEYLAAVDFNDILDEIRNILVYEVFLVPDDKKFNFGTKDEPDYKSNAIIKDVFIKYLCPGTVKAYITQYLQSSAKVKNVTMYHIKSLYRQCLTQSSQYLSGGRNFYAGFGSQ
jgi:hypothetical protein